VYATQTATIPAQITGWTPVSTPFTMTGQAHTVTLKGPAARYFLIWVTKLGGQPGAWFASISNASLLTPSG
jgi:hypothetical protein